MGGMGWKAVAEQADGVVSFCLKATWREGLNHSR